MPVVTLVTDTFKKGRALGLGAGWLLLAVFIIVSWVELGCYEVRAPIIAGRGPHRKTTHRISGLAPVLLRILFLAVIIIGFDRCRLRRQATIASPISRIFLRK